MRNRHVMALAGSVLVLAACGQADDGQNQASADANAAANVNSGPIEQAPAVPLVDGTSKVIGQVLGGDSDQGAVLKIEAAGLTPGVHGIANSFLKESALKNGPGQQILDGDGAALVIHAKADDNKTQPSGDSGDRIACAVLGSGLATQLNQ